MMTHRQRLLDILAGRPSDRPAVICPGGMMSMAVTEVMESCGAPWPAAHSDPDAMVRLAVAMHDATRFDNVALPFCMTIEAEAYGAPVDLGSMTVQPKVEREILPADGGGDLPAPDFRGGRAAVLLAALARVRALRPDVAVIGNLVGPFSLLGLLCDPLQLLRWVRRRPDLVERRMARIADDLAGFGLRQAEAGADAICIAEPTATGEILGGELFGRCVLPHLVRTVDRLRGAGVGVIVHICGDARPIERELWQIGADAVSFDSIVDIVGMAARQPPPATARAVAVPGWQVMGNISAFMLENGPPERVRDAARRLIDGGVRLIAPACGVVPTTPVAHLAAMADAAG